MECTWKGFDLDKGFKLALQRPLYTLACVKVISKQAAYAILKGTFAVVLDKIAYLQ